jgi:hypothetical protein
MRRVPTISACESTYSGAAQNGPMGLDSGTPDKIPAHPFRNPSADSPPNQRSSTPNSSGSINCRYEHTEETASSGLRWPVAEPKQREFSRDPLTLISKTRTHSCLVGRAVRLRLSREESWGMALHFDFRSARKWLQLQCVLVSRWRKGGGSRPEGLSPCVAVTSAMGRTVSCELGILTSAVRECIET